MRTLGAQGVNFVFDLCKQDLALLNAFNFYFLGLAILQINAAQALELVFGSHGSDASGESSLLLLLEDAAYGRSCDGSLR